MQNDTAFLTGGSGIFCAISRTADALPGIDNMLALSIILNVSINDILVTK